MPRAKSVADIKSNLLRPALTSHFIVTIGPPNALRSFVGNTQENLNLLCSEAVLPGSALATIDITNDFQGVTERHAYRRQFDQAIDLTFYVDATNYLPIRFFEKWVGFVMNEPDNADNELANPYYSYRVRYPDGKGDGRLDNEAYTATGLTVTKFEKDEQTAIEYEFVKSFPLAITSMPISYEGASLLKCSVQMTYIRYILKNNSSNLRTSTALSGGIPLNLGAASNAPGNMKTASGQQLHRGILGQQLQAAISRQGLPANTNRVKYTGSGNNIIVYPY